MSYHLIKFKSLAERTDFAYQEIYKNEKYSDAMDVFLAETIASASENSDLESFYRGLIIRASNAMGMGDYEGGYGYLESISEDKLTSNCTPFCQMIYYSAHMIYVTEFLGDEEAAIFYANQELKAAEVYGDINEVMRIRLNIGATSSDLGYYDTAIDMLKSAIEYFESTDDTRILAYCYINMGYTYNGLKEWPSAELYILKALYCAKKHDLVSLTHGAYFTLAQIHRHQGQFDQAMNQLESAKALESKIGQAQFIMDRGHESVRLFMELEKYDEALNEMDQMSVWLDQTENRSTLAQYYKDKSELLSIMGDYQGAYKALKTHVTKKDEDERSRIELQLKNSIHSIYKKEMSRLDAIAEIGRELTALSDIDAMLVKLRKDFELVLKVNAIGIGLVEGNNLHFEHYFNDGQKIPPRTTSLDSEVSLAVWSVNHNETMVLNDVMNESDKYVKRVGVLSSPADDPIQSALFGPLLVGEEVIGIITVQSYVKDAYSSREVKIFEILTDYMAIAVNNVKQRQALQELSVKDYLTSLYNRRGFTDYYDKQCSGYLDRVNDYPSIAILMMDLDYFKTINDTYGHGVGDQVLMKAAEVLQSYEEEGILAARLGGEEFAILALDKSEGFVRTLAEKVRMDVEAISLVNEGNDIHVTTSLGLVWHRSSEGLDYNRLYFQADKALYMAKDQGRNRVEVFKDVK